MSPIKKTISTKNHKVTHRVIHHKVAAPVALEKVMSPDADDLVSSATVIPAPAPILATVSATVSASATPVSASIPPAGDKLDSRQEFFRLMSEKIQAEQSGRSLADTSSPSLPSAPEINDHLQVKSLGLYKKIAIRFIILAALLLLVVAYFCFTKLTVVISTSKENVSDNLLVDVYNGAVGTSSDRGIAGVITQVALTQSGSFEATGIAQAITNNSNNNQFSGKVKVINTTAKAQPLVIKTRLLTADNKLFRIKNSINVPASGSTVVDVYPDKAGADMAIPATKFTIPGLALDLQTKIYAESVGAFSNGSKTVAVPAGKKVISQDDLDKATQVLNMALVAKAKDQANTSSSFDENLATMLTSTAKVELVGAKVGDVADKFDLKISNTAQVISFSSADIIKMATAKIATTIGDNKTIAGIDKNSFTLSLDKYDQLNNAATVNVALVGQAVTKNTDFIDKTKLVNLNQNQIESYLGTIKEINTFELHFFPGFIKRAPGLADRIEIQTK